MNQKDIGIVILAIAVIVLAGVVYYLYSGANKCKVMATDLGAQLVGCGAGVEQLQAGLGECTAQATQCQEAFINLQQMCAPYLPTE